MYKKVQRAQQNATCTWKENAFWKITLGVCSMVNGTVLLTNWRKSRGASSLSNELLDPEFGWEIPEVSEAFLASSKLKVEEFDEKSAKKMYVSSKNGHKKNFAFKKWTHENVSHNPTTYHWTNFCFRSLRSLIGWGHLLFAYFAWSYDFQMLVILRLCISSCIFES